MARKVEGFIMLKITARMKRLLFYLATGVAVAVATTVVLFGGSVGFGLLMVGLVLMVLLGGSALSVREFAQDSAESVSPQKCLPVGQTRRQMALDLTRRLGVVVRRVGLLLGFGVLAGVIALAVLTWPREVNLDQSRNAFFIGFLARVGIVLVWLLPVVATGAVMGAITRSQSDGKILAILLTIPILGLTSYVSCVALADGSTPLWGAPALAFVGKNGLAALLMVAWLYLLECRPNRRLFNLPGRIIRGLVYGAAAVEVAYLLFWADWRDFIFWIFGV
jgi:hypothetical protein